MKQKCLTCETLYFKYLSESGFITACFELAYFLYVVRLKFKNRRKSVKPENKNILRVLELGKEMINTAEQGDMHRKDNGCGILFGVLRDYGYKLVNLAEEEIEKHFLKGSWDGEKINFKKDET